MERLTLSYVWKQKPTPVGLRRTWREAPGATAICRRQSAMAAERPANGHQKWIVADNAYWELPKSWFNDFVDRAPQRYGRV